MTDTTASSHILGSGGPKLIIVMGVSGCGKSTTGQNVSQALGGIFVDGDDLHPAANVAKMSRGEPLTDADRAPWLKIIRERATELATQGNGVTVVACSALRKAYRELLRGKPVELVKPGSESQSNVPVAHPKGEVPDVGDDVHIDEHIANTSPPLKTYFVFIKGTRESLFERMQKRQGHFMKAGMLDSQLATLESPEGEDGVVVVDLEAPPEQQCEQAVARLKALGS
ncbi:Thermosensitive gluconokinase OS=Escherichia coli (strain K12) GN=idnK PE=3 SV=1 [Rhizoctonia solani AG-1 IB]|uniref:Gluconokinase n=1 Tax=Thanatephorus cucumeris (strain AG1-IB / isolate 7/3/14) TaxID=1108050 RepID=M5BV88_THACB|nr:gluconokinase [Rhizoctonia solani AG-1 IB]CEL56894.1 Thermosensitive gluconokinase OS=Escherichia coli (strain K12) GN=idnK PE=3 SV=1 [Rhizoctonia solani AG-1 IB]